MKTTLEEKKNRVRKEIMALMNDYPHLHRQGKAAMGTSLGNLSRTKMAMKKQDVAKKPKKSREKHLEIA